MRRTLCVTALAATLLAGTALAQTGTGGSPGCAEISQAAAAGIAARIEADDQAIPAPESVMSLTCLDNFFNGSGLNVMMSNFDPQTMLTAAASRALQQVCAAARSAWNQAIGSVQCGLTVSGWNLGFGGLMGGSFCPRLSFGGGGPALGSASLSSGAANGFYLTGAPSVPVGYPVVRPLGLQQ
jgi:hypothetical protein